MKTLAVVLAGLLCVACSTNKVISTDSAIKNVSGDLRPLVESANIEFAKNPTEETAATHLMMNEIAFETAAAYAKYKVPTPETKERIATTLAIWKGVIANSQPAVK